MCILFVISSGARVLFVRVLRKKNILKAFCYRHYILSQNIKQFEALQLAMIFPTATLTLVKQTAASISLVKVEKQLQCWPQASSLYCGTQSKRFYN